MTTLMNRITFFSHEAILMPFHVETPAPKLLCSRLVGSPASTRWSEVAEIGRVHLLDQTGMVVCVDWSAQTEELPLADIEAISAIFRIDHPAIRRCGFLLSASPFMLQLARLAVSAGNPKQRILYSSAGLVNWLGPALDVGGRDALTRFLVGYPAGTKIAAQG